MNVTARLEEKRTLLGFTQSSVAQALGITQPHYSKVVGGSAAMTPAMKEAMEAWLAGASSPGSSRSDVDVRARRLVRSIKRQLRQLDRLLDVDAARSPRRTPPCDRVTVDA